MINLTISLLYLGDKMITNTYLRGEASSTCTTIKRVLMNKSIMLLIKYASGFLILLSLALKMDDGILSQGIQDLDIGALTFCAATRMMMVRESEWSDDEVYLTAWWLFVRCPTDQSTVTWIMNNMELSQSRISIVFFCQNWPSIYLQEELKAAND